MLREVGSVVTVIGLTILFLGVWQVAIPVLLLATLLIIGGCFEGMGQDKD